MQKIQSNLQKIQKIHKKNPKAIFLKGQKIGKSQKISKNHNKKIGKKICLHKEKCYPLSFPILGGRDSTRALQSIPFQKYKNLEKSSCNLYKSSLIRNKSLGPL